MFKINNAKALEIATELNNLFAERGYEVGETVIAMLIIIRHGIGPEEDLLRVLKDLIAQLPETEFETVELQ